MKRIEDFLILAVVLIGAAVVYTFTVREPAPQEERVQEPLVYQQAQAASGGFPHTMRYFIAGGRVIRMNTATGTFTVAKIERDQPIWQTVDIKARAPMTQQENAANYELAMDFVTNYLAKVSLVPIELNYRFMIKKHRGRLIRYDSLSGQFTILDEGTTSWVMVNMPLEVPSDSFENNNNLRLILGLPL